MSRHSLKIAHREVVAFWLASILLIVVNISKAAGLILLWLRGRLREAALLVERDELLLLLGERFRRLLAAH